MADITLKDGREITFDLDLMTLEEFDALRDPITPKAVERTIIARACGLELADLTGMGYLQYSRLLDAFIRRCNDPLAQTEAA